ncbi:MAG: hypothetical protein M1834_005772 [Cirrosporium novae-zelandiae]|nr:MAG: hypothetical protein M1834_005772 [Cirrosporium novae-zelandiae]
MPKGQPTITWNDSNHTKLLYALLHEHREMKLDLAATASHFPDGVDENVLARRITKIKAAMNDNSATIMGSFDAGGANAPATPTSKARRKKLTLKKVVEDKEDGSADVDDSPTKKRKLSKVVVEEEIPSEKKE